MKTNITKYYIVIKKHEIIIASALVIISVLILSSFYLLPQVFRAREILSEKKILSKKHQDLLSKDRALKSINFQYYKDLYPKLTQILPESKDYVSMFNTFDNLESKFNVAIVRTEFELGTISTTSASLKKESDSEAYIVPLTVNIIGGLDQIDAFIQALSDLTGRIILLDNVSWSIDENIIQAQLKGKAYYYPSISKIGPIDVPIPEISSEQDGLLKQIDSSNIIVNTKSSYDDIIVGKRNIFR